MCVVCLSLRLCLCVSPHQRRCRESSKIPVAERQQFGCPPQSFHPEETVAPPLIIDSKKEAETEEVWKLPQILQPKHQQSPPTKEGPLHRHTETKETETLKETKRDTLRHGGRPQTDIQGDNGKDSRRHRGQKGDHKETVRKRQETHKQVSLYVVSPPPPTPAAVHPISRGRAPTRAPTWVQ